MIKRIGAAALLGAPRAAAAQPAATRAADAIDIHHHIVPPFYMEGARAWLTRTASNVEEVLAWTPERSLAAIGALRGLLSNREVLFGTDLPWGDLARSRAMLDAPDLSPDVLRAIERGNAGALIDGGRA